MWLRCEGKVVFAMKRAQKNRAEAGAGGRTAEYANVRSAASAGRLVLCPTPLGNLGDISARTIEALKGADVICAEDTRVTSKLLAALGISKRLERLDEQLMGAQAAAYVERVLAGEVIAYCSDAGMPGVSDPGMRLVRAARKQGVQVEVLPGPTAVATAFVASGCESAAFYFGGFFPRKDSERKQLLERLSSLDAALIFYESPVRILSALGMVEEVFPWREVSVCRELTKLHEEVLQGTAKQVREVLEARDGGKVKGEIVLVIDGPNDCERQDSYDAALARARDVARSLTAEGLYRKQIAKRLMAECGISRNDAYDLALDPDAGLIAPDADSPAMADAGCE